VIYKEEKNEPYGDIDYGEGKIFANPPVRERAREQKRQGQHRKLIKQGRFFRGDPLPKLVFYKKQNEA
jgi:hypothetical protein